MEQFAVIGDPHGCSAELYALIFDIEYTYGKIPIFCVGDLFDRGPSNYGVYTAIEKNRIFCIRGNHDDKLHRFLLGNDVTIKDYMSLTLKEFGLERKTKAYGKYPIEQHKQKGSVSIPTIEELKRFISKMPRILTFRDSQRRLFTIVHASPYKGEEYYGSQINFQGNDIRYDWWRHHNQSISDQERWGHVIFGHYWMDQPLITKWATCIDTSACLGGRLSAVIMPQGVILSVKCEDYWKNADEMKDKMRLELEAWDLDTIALKGGKMWNKGKYVDATGRALTRTPLI